MDRGLFDLTGKAALITGANSGIGLGFARGIAQHGGDLVIWGRRPEKNEEAAAELREYGGRVFTQSVDVADEQQVIAGLAGAVSELGKLDCVIANAGISGGRQPFTETRTDDWHNVLSVSLHGVFFTLREAVRHMVDRGGGGSLIVTGSLTALLGRPYKPHYSAAKAGALALMRGIAVEYAEQAIRANMIAAGRFHTDLGKNVVAMESVEQLTADVPMKRFGTIDELAGIAVYLMSDASSYHTGDVIVIDGGQTVS